MRILMLAYYYPPDSSSGSFRPFFFANHLKKLGTEITVLTVRESDFLPEQPKSYEILKNKNQKIEVVRTSALRPREALIGLKNKLFRQGDANIQISRDTTDYKINEKSILQKVKDTITDLLSCPDPHVGWIPGTVHKGLSLIKNKEIDIIWATGSPWSCFVAGTILRKISGRPLVLDFRDPWVANPNFIRRGRVSAYIEKKIEEFIVHNNDAIVANTEELRENFINRYHLQSNRVHTITNGYEETADIDEKGQVCKNERFTIVHAGALYFSRNPKNLLKAICELVEEKSIEHDMVRIQFVGGISIEDNDLDNLLRKPTLNDIVRIIPRQSHADAIKYQKNADVLLLLQPGFPLQVPRKLYEYIAIKRPILGITENNGATANIIMDNCFGRVVDNEVEALKKVIFEMYMEWKNDTCNISDPKNAAIFNNTYLAGKLHSILNNIVKNN